MSNLQLPMLQLRDLADTNPEMLVVTTAPDFRFRYVDLSAVSAGFIHWDKVSVVSYSTAPSRARRILRVGDILFGTVRPNLKSHGFVDSDVSGAIVGSTGFSVIRAKNGLSDPSYLFHCIMGNRIAAQANRDAVGSSYPALNDSDVRCFEIFAPPVNEQAAIAKILDALDATIRQAEAIIEKLKQVKQGLLHDLLTRGIAANGELRPPQSEAPDLYKNTPLGWIPGEWAIEMLGSHAQISGGVTLGRSISGLGVVELPYLRVANVQDGYLDLEEIKIVQIFKSEIARYKLECGDVLMNEGGDFDKLGRGAIWAGQLDECLHQNHVFRVRCDTSRLEPRYLTAYSGSYFGRKFFVQASKQTTNLASINSTQLKAFPLRLPPILEQHAINSRLAAIDAKMKTEKTLCNKLQEQKSGLMDDLLTGRVRVPPLLDAVGASA